MKRNSPKPLSQQVQDKSKTPPARKKALEGNAETMISTGSTLLDLAISGGRVRGGGIPGGILVEVFGPSSAGKTVLLCEIAGAVQRRKGDIMFHDPEARMNKQFARMFDLNTDGMDYSTPDTIPELFGAVRSWNPKGKAPIHGIFADSLAALSTDMEMEKDEGDKMGTRRAKEFSEELRRTCRVLAQENYLMVCSNQIRQNIDAGTWGQKYSSPGGTAIGFYSSLRLRFGNPVKIKSKEKIHGKEVTRVTGVQSTVEVFKSSIWKPYRTAPLTIIFDYGVDDIRENLQFIKDFTKNTRYAAGGTYLAQSMEESIALVEEGGLVKELREEVIDLWMEIEEKFEVERKPKQR